MIRSLLKVALYLVVLGTIFLLLILLVPRSYDALPFTERPETQYWELETGSRIGYTFLAGDTVSQQPPIIYLHGGPGGRVKDDDINFLSAFARLGYDVYLYDQIGSGHSARLEDISNYSVDRHRRDLEAIVGQIGADKVILFGHSWGTMLATEFLSKNPAKVDRLIFSGPGPILPINNTLTQVPAPDSLHLIAPKFSNREGNLKANNLRTKLVSFWARVFNKKLASDREMDRFFTYLNDQLKRSTTCDGQGLAPFSGGGGYYSHIMTVGSFTGAVDKRAAIQGTSTPLLILRGQCDNQRWGFVQEYLELFPNSEWRIMEGAGHQIEKERFGEYREIIRLFLRKGQ